MTRLEFEDVILSLEQEQIIIGTILGDGHLQPSKSARKAQFFTSSCDKDKDYVFWKYYELKSTGLFLKPPKHKRRQTPFGHSSSWKLWSKTHSLFMGYRKLFYPNGKKVVTREILDKLDDLGLSVWYMDDGSLAQKRRGQRITLHCVYSSHEYELVMDWLEQRFNLHFMIRKSEGRPIGLAIHKREEVVRFLDIIRPHIHSCMERKLG